MKYLGWLFALLLLPTQTALADSLGSFQDRLTINAAEKHYRLRKVGRPIQLSDVTGQIIGEFIFQEKQFAIVQSGNNSQLFQSETGLGFTEVTEIPPAMEVKHKVIKGNLFIETENGIYLFDDNFTQLSTAGLTVVSSGRLIVLSGELYYADQNLSSLKLFKYSQDHWQQVDSRGCLSSSVIVESGVFILCDQDLLNISSLDQLTVVIPDAVNLLASSKETILLQSSTTSNRIYVFSVATASQIDLSGSNITSGQVVGERVFLQFGTNVWHEIDWQSSSPTLFALPLEGELIGVESSPTVFVSNGTDAFTSNTFSQWLPVTIASTFSNVLQTEFGFLLWQKDGANVQLSSTANVFSLRNGAWSGSSKIKDVIETSNGVYVLLRNSSQNPNLYFTSDGNSWSRLTLVSTPTKEVTVSEARLLLPGELVELTAIGTVEQGTPQAETAYVEDSNSGIQIFLSKTKGALPKITNRILNFTGELSSSQVKRITLESLEDVEVIGSSTLEIPAISLDKVDKHLGRRAKLSGEVESLNKDYFSLKQIGELLKVHFPNAKEELSVENKVEATVIVDWNSSTDQVEAWVIDDQLKSSSVNISVEEAVLTASSTKSTGTSSKKFNSTSINNASTTSSFPAITDSQPLSFAVSPAKSSPVKTRQSQTSQYALVIMSALAVLLASRGHRFRKIVIS